MQDLDRMEVYQEIDPQGMGKLINSLADQCEEALRIADGMSLPHWENLQQVVILGMGGSAIGGDLVRALLEPEAKVPILVNRDYALPAFVGPYTLVIASSYSGNTEETLTAYAEAERRGAQLLAITSGGKLAEQARATGIPLIQIPGGISPRAAIGYSFVPILLVMEKLGLCGNKRTELAEMLAVLRRLQAKWQPAVPTTENLPKQLAQKLYGKTPLFYGSAGWQAVVALRWKGQMNENAKNLAYWNYFPELNHNETVGWEAPSALTQQTELIFLRDQGENERVKIRIEVTRELIAPHASGITDVWPVGDTVLARMFSLIYLGDYLSYYLAVLNGIDPTPVRVIDYLKQQLAAQG